MNFKKSKLWYLTPLVGLAALYFWLPFAQTTDCTIQTQIDETECHALVDLYTSTNGASWKHKSGWSVTNTPCNWYGVSCRDGYVTKLKLYYNQLSGSILESLGNLSNLESLYLNNNQLSGSIPESLGKLSSLEVLYLYDNQLSGYIPKSLGKLSNLNK
jgi:Leucine-rich repeat (LRR) protein